MLLLTLERIFQQEHEKLGETDDKVKEFREKLQKLGVTNPSDATH